MKWKKKLPLASLFPSLPFFCSRATGVCFTFETRTSHYCWEMGMQPPAGRVFFSRLKNLQDDILGSVECFPCHLTENKRKFDNIYWIAIFFPLLISNPYDKKLFISISLEIFQNVSFFCATLLKWHLLFYYCKNEN